MDPRLQDIVKNKSKNIDEIVRKNYYCSYLNDIIWYELIDGLTMEFDEIYINYKLVYDNITEGYLFDNVDFEPYFLEPIKYKEVEWIEIPDEYEYWRNRDNLKAGKTVFKQDLEAISSKIAKIGRFKIEHFSNKIRLYAYL